MPISLGNKAIQQVFAGQQPVLEIYKGSTLIWSATPEVTETHKLTVYVEGDSTGTTGDGINSLDLYVDGEYYSTFNETTEFDLPYNSNVQIIVDCVEPWDYTITNDMFTLTEDMGVTVSGYLNTCNLIINMTGNGFRQVRIDWNHSWGMTGTSGAITGNDTIAIPYGSEVSIIMEGYDNDYTISQEYWSRFIKDTTIEIWANTLPTHRVNIGYDGSWYAYCDVNYRIEWEDGHTSTGTFYPSDGDHWYTEERLAKPTYIGAWAAYDVAIPGNEEPEIFYAENEDTKPYGSFDPDSNYYDYTLLIVTS
jgi:hypothetical protein